ncbi:hypothetical protein [Chelatococcus asaccharovorans]|uniref:hypothetical protein n=1 Tax=Chelatococcus asaccharovorans TaxID=28210 RepID=UPI001473BD58|nr:hypothetical protein [Chelatococcus asaccharovorans]MBS7704133.1 hypothetical protein [Chelatococcus asaccharovorans]
MLAGTVRSGEGDGAHDARAFHDNQSVEATGVRECVIAGHIRERCGARRLGRSEIRRGQYGIESLFNFCLMGRQGSDDPLPLFRDRPLIDAVAHISERKQHPRDNRNDDQRDWPQKTTNQGRWPGGAETGEQQSGDVPRDRMAG